MHFRLTILLVTVAAALVLSGCATNSSNPNLPPLTKVTGTVHYQGQPVAGADVTFNNAAAGYTAIGKTDSAGKFVMATSGSEGVVAGKQIVAIRRVDVIDNTPPGVDVSAGGVAAPPTYNWIVPEKYSNPTTSGLTAEVPAGSPAEIPFDLK